MKLNESCACFFLFPSCVGSVKDHWVGKEDFFKYIEEDVFVLMFYLAFFSSQGANILLNDQGEVKLGRWKFALSALPAWLAWLIHRKKRRSHSDISPVVFTEESNHELDLWIFTWFAESTNMSEIALLVFEAFRSNSEINKLGESHFSHWNSWTRV